jgi:hypothetical protein
MHAFHRETARYLREELGCRQLINAGNWKTADDLRLNDVERWTYTANEVLAVNRYFTGVHDGPHKGWAIVRGDTFTSPSALLDPLQLPLNLRQVRGRPMLVTESCWVPPAGHAVEGPFLVAAYQSLTGIDGYYWFSTGDEQWTPPQSANGYLQSQQKWLFGAPETLGSFPAAALLYRKGLVKQGRPVLFEQRSLEELWERRPPALPEGSGFDPNRDAARRGDAAPGGVSPYAYLAGPVEVAFADRSAPPKVEPLETWIDAARKTVTSVTGEVRLDWGKGICTVDAPRAQGAAGFFRNASDVRLRDLQLRAGSEYGAVLAVSLDDRDLAQSRRVLVQAAAPSRPTGWKQSPVQPGEPFGPRTLFRVDDFGGPPWQVTALNLEVKVRSSLLSRAQPLDANGYGAGPAIPLAAGGEWRSFRFPAGTMHVLLE